MAISAGQCCFPYKARCAASQLSDKSSSQSYRYYEHQRGAWGAPLLGLLLAAGAVYVGAGVAWASNTAGGQGRGLAGHPHYRHWAAVHGLVMDGVAFVRGGGRRRSGGQQAAHAREDDNGGQPHDRPRKQEKKERKPKAEKAKRAKPAKAADGLGEPLAPEPPPVEAAAGGGGRWVHVPG